MRGRAGAEGLGRVFGTSPCGKGGSAPHFTFAHQLRVFQCPYKKRTARFQTPSRSRAAPSGRQRARARNEHLPTARPDKHRRPVGRDQPASAEGRQVSQPSAKTVARGYGARHRRYESAGRTRWLPASLPAPAAATSSSQASDGTWATSTVTVRAIAGQSISGVTARRRRTRLSVGGASCGPTSATTRSPSAAIERRADGEVLPTLWAPPVGDELT